MRCPFCSERRCKSPLLHPGGHLVGSEWISFWLQLPAVLQRPFSRCRHSLRSRRSSGSGTSFVAVRARYLHTAFSRRKAVSLARLDIANTIDRASERCKGPFGVRISEEPASRVRVLYDFATFRILIQIIEAISRAIAAYDYSFAHRYSDPPCSLAADSRAVRRAEIVRLKQPHSFDYLDPA